MVEAYKVGVSLVLANGVSPGLAVIAKDLLGAKGKIKEVESGFDSWNAKLISVTAILGGAGILGAMVKLVRSKMAGGFYFSSMKSRASAYIR